MIDSHAHLAMCEPPDAELVASAARVGVRRILTVGVDERTNAEALAAAREHEGVFAAVGRHPNGAESYDDRAAAELRELAADPLVRAVGETGLDFFRTGEDGRDAQLRSFRAHIAIAKERDLALQIHDRDAHREVVATLRREGAPERTVFHCFSGDAEFAKEVADEGWYLSFAGTVTFKNAGALREALEVIPRANILIETDAPYLTPMPWRGRPNSSYLLPHTLRFMAEHLGTDASMLAAQISSNTEAVYGKWDDNSVDPPTSPIDRPLHLEGG
jgi:TatD DNase family protein